MSTRVEAHGRDLEPVYVWDLLVRATHWLIVTSMLALIATGLYIGNPFTYIGNPYLESTVPEGQHFVMSWSRTIHMYAAIVFSLAVAARILWMFMGPRYARWRQLVPTSRTRRRNMVGTLKFYMLLRSEPPPATGHNPVAGLMYLGVFFLYLVMILTGFAIYADTAYGSYMRVWSFLLVVFGDVQTARWIHHAAMWVLICFAINHVFSALLTSRVEKNGILDSIFSGFKFLPKNRSPEDDE